MAVNSIVLEAKVEELGEKCAQFTKEHGVDNPDLLIDYGRALFALAKSTSSLVDNQKMDEKHSPLENPKVKVAELDEDEGDVGDEKDGDEKEGDEKKGENADEDEKNAEEEVEAVKVGGEEAAEQAAEQAEEESDAEDDFAAAFSVVDGARVLFEKQSTTESSEDKQKEVKTKLAQTRESLGDISLEDDNAPQAVEDYTETVRLKKELYGELSGQVSETEFMLSLAHEAAGDTQQAFDHLAAAANAAESAKLPSAAESRQRVDDLKTELEQAKKSGAKDQEQAKKTTAESISGRRALESAVHSLVSNANDISQLTRKRKRPAQETPQPEKKQETEKNNDESGATTDNHAQKE